MSSELKSDAVDLKEAADIGKSAPSTAIDKEDEEPVVIFRKAAPGKKNVKKRTRESTLESQDDEVAITKKSKQTSAGLVDEAANADSGVSVLEGTSYGFFYESSGAKRVGLPDQGATLSNKDLEDPQSRHQPAAATNEPSLSADGKQLYVGEAGYIQHVKKSKFSGPVRQTAHVRPDVRMDYARDICKDYKETGYCGWGDTCIFLHDRSDYKAGWQMEREAELEQKKKREEKVKLFKSGLSAKSASETTGADTSGLTVSSKDSKDLPFACYICRKPFESPVVTRCGHYFCQKCALDRFATDPSCAVCKEPTRGSFNSAIRILKRREELAKLAADESASH